MSTFWVLDHIENDHSLYRGADCMNFFFLIFKKRRKNMIDFEKRNVTVNKKRTKNTSGCNRMLNLWNKFHKIVCKR